MAFNETLKRSNRFLIAAYQQQDEQAALEVYREWYEHGRNNAEAFMAEHPNIRDNTSAVNQEMERQTSWINKAGFTATPTILVNGYVLPCLFIGRFTNVCGYSALRLIRFLSLIYLLQNI